MAWTIPPVLLNLILAFYIIAQENSKNPEFYRYFVKNTSVVTVCTVMAGADIEVMEILSSNFAGFNMFAAPFSKRANRYIFWCGLIGLFFEDIPQFGIQVNDFFLFI